MKTLPCALLGILLGAALAVVLPAYVLWPVIWVEVAVCGLLVMGWLLGRWIR